MEVALQIVIASTISIVIAITVLSQTDAKYGDTDLPDLRLCIVLSHTQLRYRLCLPGKALPLTKFIQHSITIDGIMGGMSSANRCQDAQRSVVLLHVKFLTHSQSLTLSHSLSVSQSLTHSSLQASVSDNDCHWLLNTATPQRRNDTTTQRRNDATTQRRNDATTQRRNDATT